MNEMTDIEQLQHRGSFAAGSEPELRWGILGTGSIANIFVRAIHKHTHQRAVSVGSRTPQRATEFASTHGLAGSHDSYSGAINDPTVDAVYIAVTADDHCALALEAIAAGKPVLVEKPFTVNATQAATVREAARRANVLVMEAMWTRYLPQSDAIRLLISRGVLGDVQLVSADHGQAITTGNPGSRLERADLGGGAMLDLGVYPLAFASEILGTPSRIAASGHRIPSGVDGTVAMVFEYASSTAYAHLSSTMCMSTPNVAAICGSSARIEIDSLFFIPSSFRVTKVGILQPALLSWRDQTSVIAHEGLCYQATAMARYVAEGRVDSPILGLDETVSILATIDQTLAAIDRDH
jgi:predicted dehydrogenase